MTDRCADILEQLDTVLQTVADAEAVAFYHNRASLRELQRPCIVMLDGRETMRLTGSGKGRRQISPGLATLIPQIFVLLKNEEPLNIGQSVRLSNLRLAILKAIARDAVLVALVGSNGEVIYNGHITDFEDGSSMDGKLQMLFEFVYVLNPYQD